MTGRRVHLDEDRFVLKIGDGSAQQIVRNDGAHSFSAHITDVEPASATSMRHALLAADMDLLINDGPKSEFDYENSWPSQVGLHATPDEPGLCASIIAGVDGWTEEPGLVGHVAKILAPLQRRLRFSIRTAEMGYSTTGSPYGWDVTLAMRTRGRTVGEVFEDGQQILALLEAAGGGGLTLTTTADLLRAGRAEVIIGQPEGQWLDVKKMDYDLVVPRGKISVAQDVARFANGEGGLVVVGMATRKVRGGEVISGVTPVPVPALGMRRHQQAVEHRVFPIPEGIGYDIVPVEGGALLLISLPPQPEELKPFLVTGAIVEGKVEGAYISILRRSGEGSVPITAQAIHSTLAAGRALLRRGQLMDDS